MDTTLLPNRLQKLVDQEIPKIDILHGELKNMMYTLEGHKTGQNTDNYWEAQLEILTDMYLLVVQLSFATPRKES